MKGNELQSVITEALGKYELSPVIIETIRFILNNRFESMTIVNDQGEIEFMDRRSEKIFDYRHGAAQGKPVCKAIPNSNVLEVVNSGVPQIGDLFEIEGVPKIISRYPITKDDKIIGAFGRLTFYSSEALDRTHAEANRPRIRAMNAESKTFAEHRAIYTFNDILGVSEKIRKQVILASRLAQAGSDVLIEGESGTGKELFAHAIHNHSMVKTKPFVKVNCPAIPNELAEAELFGYERGAFTGARNNGKVGKFELGNGGTIFLDEICSLPISMQAKLLRVLQGREIERVGGRRLIQLNFRLITATNSNLKALAEEGRFRSDLYYRISQTIIQIPPLRERPEDIPVYARHFLGFLKKRLDHQIERISPEALDLLMRYRWPGNVRELVSVLERSIFLAESSRELKPEHLPKALKEAGSIEESPMERGSLSEILSGVEKEIILKTLKVTNGNKKKAAQRLGIQRSALYQKLEKHNISAL